MKNILSTLILLVSVTLWTYGQTTTIYSYEQALPSDTVNCIAQDADGDILIGTANGLVRYDGTSFNVITTADGLAGNTINDISVAPNGKIYVATNNGVSVSNDNTWQNDITGGDIRKIAGTDDGRFWYSTTSNAVIEYNSGNTTPLADNYGFSNGITGLYADRSENVWVSCNGNMVEICANGKIKSFDNTFSGKIVYDVYQRFNGDIIAATSRGIMSYDYNSWTAIAGINTGASSVAEDFAQNIIYGNLNGVYRHDGSSCTLLNGDFAINDLLVSGPNPKRIWCSDAQNGIAVMDFDGNAETYHTNLHMLNHTPNFIWGDNAGNVCIAGSKGVNVISDFTWLSYTKNLQNISVNASYISNDTLWIGTNAALLYKTGRNVSALAQTNINDIDGDATAIYAATNSGILKISNGIIADTIGDELNVSDIIFAGNLFAIAGNSIYKEENGEMVQVSISVTLDDASRFVKTSSGNIFITTGNTIARFNPSGSPVTESIEPDLPQTIVSAAACDENVYALLQSGAIYEYSTMWTEVTEGNYQDIASAGNGILWAINSNGNVTRICINCNTTFTVASQAETCDGSSDASLSISATEASSYSIDNGETWQTSGTFDNISGGYKHLLAKNSDGKIIADSLIFVEYGTALYNQRITYSQPECYGETGSIVLSELGISTFAWENGNTALTERQNLGTGNYSVTISSAECQRILASTITAKQQISISGTIENPACFNDNSGSIVLAVTGGSTPYSYTWSNSAETANIENLDAGEYICTITDRNMCTAAQTYVISQPDSLSATAEAIDITCFGSNNGSISTSVSGGTQPYQYIWNDGNTSANRTDLAAGNYSLTITDANNCTTNISQSISQPTALSVTGNATNISCYSMADGSITISAEGGSEPYQYVWSDGETSDNRTSLQADEYTVTVTDANSCTANFSASISEPAELIASADITPIVCAGANDAQLTATATGGTGTYAQYFWLNENHTPVWLQQQYQNVAPGTYYLVVKDSHNCTDTIMVNVEDAQAHNFETSVTDASCNGASNGAISITAGNENIADFAFAWSENISASNTANNLTAGSYTVSITDASDCETTLTAEVNEPEIQQIDMLADMNVCEGMSYTLSVGNYNSYLWSNGMTSQQISVSDEGEYSVTVTDNMNCRMYDSASVTFISPYDGDELALATVTDSNTVVLRWNKTDGMGTSLYRIYRDAGEGFVNIATVNFNETAMYEDTTVNALEQYYDYKVTAVSSCGDESETETYHRSIVLAAICDPNNVCNLNWNPYVGVNEVFTYLMAGESPETLEIIDSVLFSTYNYIQMNQYENGTYYRVMIKLSNPLVSEGITYDRIYSNIVRCGGTDPVDPPVMADESSISNISAYPNPFGDAVTIEFENNGFENVEYEVINAIGQVVAEDKNATSPIIIGSELERGFYIVRLRAGNEIHNLKISKQ